MLSEVYDLETLSNLFTYTGYCRQTKTFHQFVIHQSLNQYKELLDHIRKPGLIMIGFNNLNYDYPLLHHMLNHEDEYSWLSGFELSQKIYQKSQEIIDMQFSAVADWNTKIRQIDLMRVHHYDNLARLTSLKALEISMNLPFVEDMPFSHEYWITTQEEIGKVLSYNKKDVEATNEFLNVTLGDTEHPFYKGKNKLELRYILNQKYKLPCLNWNDVKIGTELILKLYCQKFNLDPKVIRKLRTYRPEIKLKDCLPIWTEFNTNTFKQLQSKIEETVLRSTKGDFKLSVIYQNIKIDYGTGGAHASINPGICNSNEEFMILDVDADGLYPSLAIQQELFPEHLGLGFLDIYNGEIVSKRLIEKKKPKKERDFVIVEGFKLAANGWFGKTNAEDSFAYDPLYTMKTTISGQIMISMWIERLISSIPDLKIIQINTDGISILVKRSDYDRVVDITSEITKITGLTFEFNEYLKMVIVNVNNYIAQYTSGECKYKGLFEIDKELHKDPSMRIVPIALSNYFIKGIPIEETIRNHTDIYDFCLRLKVNKGWEGEYKYVDSDLNFKIQKLSKNTRYYISNKGGSLFKKSNDGRISGVSVGFVTTIFNNYEKKEMKDYDINYSFYIKECNKIIDQIEVKQLSLF